MKAIFVSWRWAITLGVFLASVTSSASPNYAGAVITLPNLGTTQSVLVFRCTADCSNLTAADQLGNNGYVTSTMPQTTSSGGIVQPAPWVFLYQLGTYALFQINPNSQQPTNHPRNSRSKAIANSPQWNSCTVTLDAQTGLDTTAKSSCPGLVRVNAISDPVVNLNTYNNNGNIMPPGTSISAGLQPPTNYRTSQPVFPSNARALNVSYLGKYAAICLNTAGLFTRAPCSGSPQGDSHDLIVKKGSPIEYLINPNQGSGLFASAFVVSGVQTISKGPSSPSRWVTTGQDFGTPNSPAYGSRFEFAFFPQFSSGSGPNTSTGVSTVDMSLVNGYNFGFRLYPANNTICAKADTENGPSHFDIYNANSGLSRFPTTNGQSPKQFCPASNVATDSKRIGCLSDCSLATKQQSLTQDQFCCTGTYNTVASCPPPKSDPPPYNVTPPKPIPRPFSDALGLNKNALYDAYTWAYEDFRGTFTCDGNSSGYTLEITDF